MQITSSIPQLRTTNLTDSINFYTTKLGLTLEFQFEDFYAGIRAGNSLFHLKLSDEKDASIEIVDKGGHFHLYLETDDAVKAAAELKNKGVPLVEDLHDTNWGTREFVVKDDQGHTLYFGQYLGRQANAKFPAAVPEIPVSHIDKAVAYYHAKLGFNRDWGSEELGLAGISRGNCRLFLANSSYRQHNGNRGPALSWINLTSKEEVDDLYNLWRTNGAKVLSAPESKPWGLHEFVAEDLDGNLFRVFYDFATPARGKL